MADDTSRATDWAILERVEFKTLGDVWQWSGWGAAKARNTGLIIMHAKHDLHEYMKDISSDPRTANSRARRISNHLGKVANHLAAIKGEFEKIPAEVMKVYEPEITAARRKNKPKIDLTK